MTKKPSDIKEQALEQMRKTQAKINQAHPELLSTLKNQLSEIGKSSPKAPVWARDINATQQELPQTELKIDRKKNMESIMKFLEIKGAHSPVFQEKLKEVLRDTKI